MNTCVLSVCLPPNSSSYGEALALPVVVFRGGAFGFMWGHGVRCHDKKGPCKKRDREQAEAPFSLSTLWGHTEQVEKGLFCGIELGSWLLALEFPTLHNS